MSQSIAVKDELQKSTATAPPDAVSQQSDNVAHALAGSGGGLISMALTYPLITLSTRAQVESKKADTNVLQAAQKIIAREGVRGLYAGLESALFGISVTNFVYYYWYEWTRAAFIKAAKAANRPNATKLSTVESMLAGALAGSATVLLTNPIWVVNTRMTARKNESDDSALPTEEAGVKPKKKLSPSTIGTLLSIIKDEGFMRLFAGVLPALVLVINPILQYTIFEQLKQSLEKRRRVTPKDSFYLGALGKLAATSITYPYITVKSRAHVASGQKEGMFDSFSRILREEGWAGLYGGIGPKVTQSVITAAFLFAFKDALYNATVKARRSIAQKAPGRTGPTNRESNDEKHLEKNEKSRMEFTIMFREMYIYFPVLF
ncbi:peroxisomal membrane protein PMP47A [Aureobasidium pullulans]|nr:peroxisomal membrane protein PMP47A [Aureobasidium pullulans]